jgi:hypothetical protein
MWQDIPKQRNPNKELYKLLVGERQGQRSHRRPRVCVWEDNVKMDHNNKMNCEVINWIGLSKDMIQL